MRIVDDRPERSLSDSILRALGWLTVCYFAGELVRQYVPPEVLQSLLEFLLEFRVPLVLHVVLWVVLLVLLFVVILQMPQRGCD
jgi:uncharacterized membrane protein YhdT